MGMVLLITYCLTKGTPIASKLAVFLWSGKGCGRLVSKFKARGSMLRIQPGTLNVESDKLSLVPRRLIFPDQDDGAMSDRIGRTNLKILLRALLICAFVTGNGATQERGTLSEYRDDEFGYGFLYPAEWKLETLPEGEANPGMRLRLRGPVGSSFVVIVERTGQPLSKLEFQADPKAAKRVEAMMRQTLAQTYRAISKSLGALSMKTGEQRDLSDEHAIRFYIATLHRMKTGNPVIVAGTHAYPFAKDYSVNFIMTAYHRGNAAENRLLTTVFNSFRLVDSPPK